MVEFLQTRGLGKKRHHEHRKESQDPDVKDSFYDSSFEDDKNKF